VKKDHEGDTEMHDGEKPAGTSQEHRGSVREGDESPEEGEI